MTRPSRASRQSRKRVEIPKPPIGAVLKELTGEEVREGLGWVRIQCPFHEDRTPSASVNHELNGFACHSCGRSGDALKLLQDELRIDFKEACDKARALGGAVQARPKRRPSDLLKKGYQ